ncbi:tRNA uracil 4-sulfurtransferase ThiI [Verrucomicrobiota bacterium]
MMNLILIRYASEVATKGKNRSMFVNALRRNIKDALKRNEIPGNITIEHLRIYVELENEADMERTCEVLKHVFGISSFSPVARIENDLEIMQATALEVARRANLGPDVTFRVSSRRSNKQFPLKSPEIDRHVGGFVRTHTDAKLDLYNPEVTIGVEVGKDDTKIYAQNIRGAAGLPIGTQSRVFVLLSSGIDSIVATWLMLRRGCQVIPVHFTQDPDKAQKVRDLCDQLNKWCYGWKLYPMIIDHHDVMKPVVEKLKAIRQERWACVYCKRAMLNYVCDLAEEHRCEAITMGDSLGQVASQTMANMKTISDGCALPILRPVLTYEKEEIIELARKIGTFDISIRKEGGCPFLPQNPITQASAEKMAKIEAAIDSL